jgi:hypothetical protein
VLEEAEPRIEKQVEFFDPALENFCGDEVPKLVKYNQEAQAHQQLRYFNSDFHFLLSIIFMCLYSIF